MHHESYKWIAMAFALIGGLSSVAWVLYAKSGESDMTALRDGLYLEYETDTGDPLCRLTFTEQGPDRFTVASDAEECVVMPYSAKTRSAVNLVDARARAVDAALVSWGYSESVWIAPDAQEPNPKALPGSFVVRERTTWREMDVSVIEITVGGLTRRFYYDTKTGFLAGMEEKGVDHEAVGYVLASTNAP